MLYAIGFIGLFTIGGLTGLFLAAIGLDVHVHDTYFVVAHFHYIMVGGAIMGYLGGLHFWWPKITGRLYPEMWARVAAVIVFVGFNLTFFPQFILGYLGMPRRYHAYPEEFQVLNVMSSAGASILGVGYLLPDALLRLVDALRRARPRQPVGRQGPGVGDDLAARHRELPRAAGGARGGVRVREGPGGDGCLKPRPPPSRRSPTTSRTWASRRRPPASGMWLFIAQEVMFFGGLFLAYTVYRNLYPAAFAEASHHLDWKLGGINTAVLIVQQPDHGPGRPRGRPRPPQADRALPDR